MPKREAATNGASQSGDQVDGFLQTFRLLSDETRLRILFSLMEHGEMHVRGLCELLKRGQPTVSHQLAILRDAGLVDMRREGKFNYYRVLPGRIGRGDGAEVANGSPANFSIRFHDMVLWSADGK